MTKSKCVYIYKVVYILHICMHIYIYIYISCNDNDAMYLGAHHRATSTVAPGGGGPDGARARRGQVNARPSQSRGYGALGSSTGSFDPNAFTTAWQLNKLGDDEQHSSSVSHFASFGLPVIASIGVKSFSLHATVWRARLQQSTCLTTAH